MDQSVDKFHFINILNNDFIVLLMIQVNSTPEFAKMFKTLDKKNPLYKELDAILEVLTENPKVGNLIRFNQIPKTLKKKYPELSNLLRVEVNRDWRLLYTLRGFPNNKEVFVLMAMPHKEYDKLFGY